MDFALRDMPTRRMLEDIAKEIPQMDVDAIETFVLFLRTASELFKKVSMNLSCCGLSQGRMSILMTLLRNSQGLAPSEIAERLNVTRGTMTGLLDGLEREQLIERLLNPSDRRMVTIQLTKKGRDLLIDILPGHFTFVTKIIGVLTEQEQKAFLGSLEKLHKQIQIVHGMS